MMSTTASQHEFGNPLAAPAPLRQSLAWRPWLCLGLVVACMLPRALMAWRADVICEDGPFYVMAAQHLEQGAYAESFATGNLRLNTFPIILALLHQLGFEWVAAGQWWGVLASSLAVLPMFGWARRQFNDSVATLTGLIYACHPALIERSPEVLRCPTHWLLLMLTLYLLWRAVVEVRLGFFLLGGLTLALGAHTRVEAWFLLIPVALWCVARFVALESGRRRLALGAVLCAAMLPAFIAAVNLTWLRNHSDWEFCFSHRIDTVRQCLGMESPAPIAVIDPEPQMPLHHESISAGQLAWQYVRKLSDAFGALGGLLTLLGLASHWRVFLRRDQLAVFCMTLAHLAAIAVHQGLTQDVIGRYFFPIVMVSMPYMALGLMNLADRLTRLLEASRFAARTRWASPPALSIVLMLVLGLVGCADALTNSFTTRRQRRDLGQWVLEHYGSNQLMVGSQTRELMLMYYSQGRYAGLKASDLDSEWFRHIMRADPIGVVVLWKNRPASADAVLAERFQHEPQLQLEYRPVPAERLPASCRNVTVLVRQLPGEQVARKPASTR